MGNQSAVSSTLISCCLLCLIYPGSRLNDPVFSRLRAPRFPVVLPRGGSPRNTRNRRKRKAQRARIHAIPTSYARWFFVRIFRGFPSPAHRPRCIVAGEKHHAPIHHCIRIVKEGEGTCLHFEYGTSFPA